MSTAAKYKRHAADCLRLAQLVSAPGDRAVLTEMAAMWLWLADRAELMSEQPRGKRFGHKGNEEPARETGEDRS
jgi:hypothetical protein